MADVSPSGAVKNEVVHARRDAVVLWETLTNTNTAGSKISIPGAVADMVVQVSGTFNSATVVMQGSNDGSAWVTVKDPNDAAVSLTAAGHQAIRDKYRFMRPSTSGGTAGQDVDVRLVISRSQNL